MQIPLDTVLFYASCALVGVSSLCFALGIFSAIWPGRSMDLYIGFMARINWRVSPIDEGREIRTTRRYGIYLILLSVISLGIVYFHRVHSGFPLF